MAVNNNNIFGRTRFLSLSYICYFADKLANYKIPRNEESNNKEQVKSEHKIENKINITANDLDIDVVFFEYFI